MFQGKQRWSFLLSCSALSLGGNSGVKCLHSPLTTASLFAIGTHECKPHWLTELGNLGAHSSCGSLKSWSTTCVVQTLCFSGTSWELGAPSDCKVLCQGLGLWWNYVSFSYPFWRGYFLSCPMCRNHSTSFWIPFRVNWSMYIILVHLQEEGKSKASYVAILVMSLWSKIIIKLWSFSTHLFLIITFYS